MTALRRQRDALQKRTAFLVAHLDEETLADAKAEVDKLKADRRRLDDQIAAAEATPNANLNAGDLAERLFEKTKIFFIDVSALPNHFLREWLAAVVEKVVVDMETKATEIYVRLPREMLKSAFSDKKAMRLGSSSVSSSLCETHRRPGAILFVMMDCQYRKASNRICYCCHRRSAE